MRRYKIDIPMEVGRAGRAITDFLCAQGPRYLDDDRDEPAMFEFTRAVTYSYALNEIAAKITRNCADASLNYRVIGIEPMKLVDGVEDVVGVRIVIAPTVGLASLCG